MIECRSVECKMHQAHWFRVVQTGRWHDCATSWKDALSTYSSAMMVCEVFHEQISTEFKSQVRDYRTLLLRGVTEALDLSAPRLGNIEYFGVELNHRRAYASV